MIPEFPHFKNVELADREAVEAYAERYPHYSDFNFTSLYSWDTNSARALSKLNGNLVARLTDYSTDEPFLSFFGTEKSTETAETLIAYAPSEGIAPVLHMVPEISIHTIESPSLRILQERDHFDYVYLTQNIAALAGNQYKSKRKQAEKFAAEHPDTHVEITGLSTSEVQSGLLQIVRDWGSSRTSATAVADAAHEEAAVRRLFALADSKSFEVGLVVTNGELTTFTVEELLPRNYAISHFWKSRGSYTGDYDFLNRAMAQHLMEKGVLYWNWEQDLGLENLRFWKSSYRPCDFLKKFSVSAALPVTI